MYSRRTALVAATFLALAASVQAAPLKGERIDIGPAVGAHIPKLVATDSTGAPRALADLAGRKGLVLVFFRSARWCPFCQHQLMDLRDVQADLEKRGYALAAISYDKPPELAAFAKKWDVRYTLLSDAGSTMIDAFKLRDPQYPPGSFAYGVPKPSIFVIDRRGVVRSKIAREGYEIRPSDAEVLATADDAG
jgi:peroxiredoxin